MTDASGAPNSPASTLVTTPNNQPPILTGAILPNDMRVNLVRAENAFMETLLTIFFSITLTLFGVFLGPWVTSPCGYPVLAMVGTIAFAGLSVLFLVFWIIIKVNNSKEGVTIPLNLLGRISGQG